MEIMERPLKPGRAEILALRKEQECSLNEAKHQLRSEWRKEHRGWIHYQINKAEDMDDLKDVLHEITSRLL